MTDEELKNIIRNSDYSATRYQAGKKQGQAEALVLIIVTLVISISIFVFLTWPIIASS